MTVKVAVFSKKEYQVNKSVGRKFLKEVSLSKNHAFSKHRAKNLTNSFDGGISRIHKSN